MKSDCLTRQVSACSNWLPSNLRLWAGSWCCGPGQGERRATATTPFAAAGGTESLNCALEDVSEEEEDRAARDLERVRAQLSLHLGCGFSSSACELSSEQPSLVS